MLHPIQCNLQGTPTYRLEARKFNRRRNFASLQVFEVSGRAVADEVGEPRSRTVESNRIQETQSMNRKIVVLTAVVGY